MSCPTLDTLTNATFNNACVISNVVSNSPVQSAFQTCCGSSNVHTSGCYTYCNITSAEDQISWSYCMLDNVDLNVMLNLDQACPNNFDDSATTASGAIATTWGYPTQIATVTISSNGCPVETDTFDGSMPSAVPGGLPQCSGTMTAYSSGPNDFFKCTTAPATSICTPHSTTATQTGGSATQSSSSSSATGTRTAATTKASSGATSHSSITFGATIILGLLAFGIFA